MFLSTFIPFAIIDICLDDWSGHQRPQDAVDFGFFMDCLQFLDITSAQLAPEESGKGKSIKISVHRIGNCKPIDRYGI